MAFLTGVGALIEITADATCSRPSARPLRWIAVPLLLIPAVMLVAGVGDAGLWITVFAVGVALVAIDVIRSRHA